MTAAMGARTDLSFDVGTGTLTYTGTGSSMTDLVINLGTVDDTLVEGPEQYTVALTSPGSTTGAAVVGTSSVTTTITDNDTADPNDFDFWPPARPSHRAAHSSLGRRGPTPSQEERTLAKLSTLALVMTPSTAPAMKT